LSDVAVPALPRVEAEEVVLEGRGFSSAHVLLSAYERTIENFFLAWQYHFEMLNLGYAAYLNLFEFCGQAFPGVTDETVAQMVAGTDLLFFRPEDELKHLARLALHLGVGGAIRREGSMNEVEERLRETTQGKTWLEAFDASKDPWFYFSNSTGFYHHHRSWIDDLNVPLASIRRFMSCIEAGDVLERPTAEILERRERMASEYRSFLTSEADQEAFDENLALARKVAGFIEDHNFFIEHRFHTIFWNKIREFGGRLVEADFLADPEDIFYLNRWEVAQALYEMVATWASGGPARGPRYWPPLVEHRRGILDALRTWSPPATLGPVPEHITEPLTVVLCGITKARVDRWSRAQPGDREIRGVAASPGVAEGLARVVLNVDDLASVQEGEILVSPVTAPSWGIVFERVRAAVSDSGGVMSHAAIVSREYGLPAVAGTGVATKLIRTGDRIRVDGSVGTVEILD
jgi:pyruvate,water dikinase